MKHNVQRLHHWHNLWDREGITLPRAISVGGPIVSLSSFIDMNSPRVEEDKARSTFLHHINATKIALCQTLVRDNSSYDRAATLAVVQSSSVIVASQIAVVANH